MATLSNGTTTITPFHAYPAEYDLPMRTIVSDVLDSPEPAYSLAPAGLRTGQLRLVAVDEAQQLELEQLLSRPAVFEFTDPDHPARSVRFVPVDRVGFARDAQTGRPVVTIPYRKVGP